MIFFLKIFLVSTAIFIILDLLWLGIVAKKFYQKHLGELLAPRVNWYAAILFYFIFNLGMLFFVILPVVSFNTILAAIVFGSSFGLVTYATYDLTNMATLKKWPLVVTIVDIVWGMLIGAITSVVVFLLLPLLS